MNCAFAFVSIKWYLKSIWKGHLSFPWFIFVELYSIWVLNLGLWSTLHSGFCESIKPMSKLMFTCQYSFIQHHLLKRMSLLHYLSLLFARDSDCICGGLFCTLFCSIDLFVYCFDSSTLSCFRVSLESGNVNPPMLLFFSIMLTNMLYLASPYKF